MWIERQGITVATLVCCAMLSACLHAQPPWEAPGSAGKWAVEWCDKTAPERECGGFSVDLQQDGDRIDGESFGARVGLSQIDEGGEVHGIALGDAAVLTVESVRSGAIYLVKATRRGDCLQWNVRDTVRLQQQDIDIVAMDDVLARSGARCSKEAGDKSIK